MSHAVTPFELFAGQLVIFTSPVSLHPCDPAPLLLKCSSSALIKM